MKNAADQIGAYAFFDGALAFSVAITVTHVTEDQDASRKIYTDNLSKLRNNPTKKEHIPMLYKVALMVRSFSVLPIDAWVNNYSTKSGKNVPQPLKKALIGGFGMVYCEIPTLSCKKKTSFIILKSIYLFKYSVCRA